jgi:hypothetical protein
MGFFDPLMNIFIDAMKAVVEPVLSAVISIFLSILTPIIQISAIPILNIITTIFNTVVPTMVDTLFQSIFNKSDGWNWLKNLAFEFAFAVIYLVFLYGYSFVLRFGEMFLQFLPVPILLCLCVLPIAPLAYFIYECITTFLQVKNENNDIIGTIMYIIDQIRNALHETRMFFLDNILNILLKFGLIFLYQVFLFGYDLFSSLPPIEAQLVKLGMVGEVVISVILYYPVWWFLYSFFIEKKNISDIPTRILKAMDSVTDTILFAWNWIGASFIITWIVEKIGGIIGVFTNKA